MPGQCTIREEGFFAIEDGTLYTAAYLREHLPRSIFQHVTRSAKSPSQEFYLGRHVVQAIAEMADESACAVTNTLPPISSSKVKERKNGNKDKGSRVRVDLDSLKV